MTVALSTLGNGLRVVTHHMPTVETVSLGVWVRAGTRDEPAALNGVSHLLEHMAFKGTETRSARDIAEQIENVGGHLNAYTSRETTAYHATVLKEDAALGLELLADILRRSVFDPDELERERAVVLQEIGEARDTPDDVVFDLFQDAAYPDQPMGRPVLGPPDIVARLTRDALVGYMARHYVPGRMVLAAAGRIEHDAVVALADRHFGDLAPGDAATVTPAAYGGGDRREDRALEQVHLVLGFDAPGYHDPDYYAAGVASTLLGGGMSSRLFQEIREKRGLAYSIYSFTSSYDDGGLLGVYAGVGADGVAELAPVLCAELGRAAVAVGEDELARAKAQLRAAVVMSLESTQSRAEQLARQVQVFGAPIAIDDLQARIAAVDCAAARRALERMLSTPPSLAAVGPLDRLMPYDDFAAGIAGA